MTWKRLLCELRTGVLLALSDKTKVALHCHIFENQDMRVA